MSEPTTIQINDVEYVRKDTLSVDHSNSPIKIVILQRGWVMVGRWGRDGDDCWLDDAQVIERWGTSKGLGELVDGPTADTRLRPAGHVEFHILGVVASLTANAARWSL